MCIGVSIFDLTFHQRFLKSDCIDFKNCKLISAKNFLLKNPEPVLILQKLLDMNCSGIKRLLINC